MTIKAQVDRISHDQLFMSAAHLFSLRSTCNRGQVGCVAVRDKRVICAGYNGAPAGFDHCTDVGCGGAMKMGHGKVVDTPMGSTSTMEWIEEFPNGCTRAVHAEANMVYFAAKTGICLEDCAVYCTSGPCLNCAYALVGAGIYRLVYKTPYRLDDGLKLVVQAGIIVDQAVRNGS